MHTTFICCWFTWKIISIIYHHLYWKPERKCFLQERHFLILPTLFHIKRSRIFRRDTFSVDFSDFLWKLGNISKRLIPSSCFMYEQTCTKYILNCPSKRVRKIKRFFNCNNLKVMEFKIRMIIWMKLDTAWKWNDKCVFNCVLKNER